MTSTSSFPICARIDELLHPHREALGADYQGLRNHCQRVYALTIIQMPNASLDDFEQVAIASAYHDLGIWTHLTFNYLQPSIQLACTYLCQIKREEWIPTVSTIILDHHKITGSKGFLAEAFRQADLMDISWGYLGHKYSRVHFLKLQATFPPAGFYRCLMIMCAKRLLSHPWSPFPMVRL